MSKKSLLRKEIKQRAKLFRGNAQDKIISACENFNHEFPGNEALVADVGMELLIKSMSSL